VIKAVECPGFDHPPHQFAWNLLHHSLHPQPAPWKLLLLGQWPSQRIWRFCILGLQEAA